MDNQGTEERINSMSITKKNKHARTSGNKSKHEQKGNRGNRTRNDSGGKSNYRNQRPHNKQETTEATQKDAEGAVPVVNLNNDPITDEVWDDEPPKNENKETKGLNPTAMEFTPNALVSTTSTNVTNDEKEPAWDDISESEITSEENKSVSSVEHKKAKFNNSLNTSSGASETSDDCWNGSQASWRTTGKLQSNNYKLSKSSKDRNITITDARNQTSDSVGNEFDNFNKHWEIIRREPFVVVDEIEEDLFALGKEYALAHCVATDLSMGAGIAITFKQEFKQVGELLAQNQTQGGLAFLNISGRFIYYLVTKRESRGKPTYETMFRSLHKLKEHMVTHKVDKLAIPRLGCGLDRLDWDKVKCMLEYIFKDTSVKITVCNFQKADETTSERKEKQKYRSCPVNDLTTPITEAISYSIILYLGSVRGQTDRQFDAIDGKYRILQDYKRSRRELGSIITTVVQDYKFYVIGCIVREQDRDMVDFRHFETCIREINKQNNKFAKNCENYEQLSMQIYRHPADDLLMEKLVFLMKDIFNNLTINIHDHE